MPVVGQPVPSSSHLFKGLEDRAAIAARLPAPWRISRSREAFPKQLDLK